MKTGGMGLWRICELYLKETDEIRHEMELRMSTPNSGKDSIFILTDMCVRGTFYLQEEDSEVGI